MTHTEGVYEWGVWVSEAEGGRYIDGRRFLFIFYFYFYFGNAKCEINKKITTNLCVCGWWANEIKKRKGVCSVHLSFSRYIRYSSLLLLRCLNEWKKDKSKRHDFWGVGHTTLILRMGGWSTAVYILIWECGCDC